MSYQALLFCPDEKTARTVTQVLSELEFSVEPCAEPFAAVKKLMGQHFDAVVVDCDNEQNATLLFKSARNSTSNQASLAVAVVEGQAGVAKAFRIGANLVLTKPINVEQAKGTLRVARGLLRKGEAAKPATPAPATPASATPAAAATPGAAPATPRPTAPAPKPAATPVAAKPSAPRPQPPTTSTFGEAPAMAPPVERRKASTIPSTAKLPPAIPLAAPARAGTASAESKPAPKPAPKPATSFSAAVFNSAAASAPAPARAAQPAPPVEDSSISSGLEGGGTSASASPSGIAPASAPPHIEASHAESSPLPAPSFTFGGANAPEESTGGSKKILLGLVALVVVGALAYVGWSTFGRHSDSPAVTAAPAAKPIAPPITAPAPAKPSAEPAPDAASPASSTAPNTDDTAPVDDTPPAPVSTKPAPSPGKANAPAAKPAETTSSRAAEAPAPLVIKGGAAPAVKPAPAPDTAAPSMIGIANPASNGAMPNLGSAATATPVLQRLNVSQGVSRGLLIKKVDPIYPPSAINMKVEGTVELSATISKSGDITTIKVLSGNRQLTQAALDAVKRWKYKPYLLNGEPVEIQTQVTIVFKLPQ
jgi:periplasmic protein TonB